jgi:hypothetical protein
MDLTSLPDGYIRRGVSGILGKSILNEYKNKLLDERYQVWRGGASRDAFHQREIAEYERRDQIEGTTEERIRADLDDTLNAPTYVKFDPETGRPIGIYKKTWIRETKEYEETLVKN